MHAYVYDSLSVHLLVPASHCSGKNVVSVASYIISIRKYFTLLAMVYNQYKLLCSKLYIYTYRMTHDGMTWGIQGKSPEY